MNSATLGKLLTRLDSTAWEGEGGSRGTTTSGMGEGGGHKGEGAHALGVPLKIAQNPDTLCEQCDPRPLFTLSSTRIP